MTGLSYGSMRAANRPEATRHPAGSLRAKLRRNPLAAAASARTLSAVSAFFLVGCVPTGAPPRAVSYELAPRLVSPPPKPRCSARSLATKTLWAGSIVARLPATREISGRRLVREEWALCGALDSERCFDWARNAATERGRIEGLVPDVEQGSIRRGRLWTFEIGHQNVAYLFGSNQELVSYLRPFRNRDDERPAIVDVADAVEPRFHRMVVRYFEPERTLQVPASIWTLEFDRSEQGASDAMLAISDLEEEGIDVEPKSRQEFVDEARAAAQGVLTLPFTGHSAPSDGPPVSVELIVHCHVD